MGVPYRCPRMGGWDKGNTSWQRISQSEIRKIAAAKKEAAKARTGPEGETSFPYGVNKNSSFLPARAEKF